MNSIIDHSLSHFGEIQNTIKDSFFNCYKKYFEDANKVKVLSVSTGYGVWDYLLLKNFSNISEIWATDINSDILSKCERKKLSESGNWNFKLVKPEEPIPLEDNYFDFIYHMDVIEHVNKPYSFISDQYRMLKPEGVLFLTTPNLLRPANILRLLTGKLFFPRQLGVDENLLDCTHIQEFTIWQLKNILQEIGFKKIEIHYLYFGFLQYKITDLPHTRFTRSMCHYLGVTAVK